MWYVYFYKDFQYTNNKNSGLLLCYFCAMRTMNTAKNNQLENLLSTNNDKTHDDTVGVSL